MTTRRKNPDALIEDPALAMPREAAPLERDGQVASLDAMYAEAGLVHSRKKSGPSPLHVARRKREEKEDLFRPATGLQKAPNGVGWLAVPAWEKFDWLWHGFSTRLGGVSSTYCPEGAPGELNLGFTPEDEREKTLANRRLLAEAITGSAATPLIALRQIHSNLTRVARASDAADESPARADGLFLTEPGALAAIQTADCIPVLLADRKRRVVAAFHAGWRGTVQRIVERGVGRMRLEFGSKPEDLTAAIGPGVGPCCYGVGEELYTEFLSQFDYAEELFHEVYSTDEVRTRYPMLFLTQRAPGHSPELGPHLHLDLAEANRRQLLAAGLKPRAIHRTGGCTSCQRDLFFSHRAAQGRAGRMMSVIGIRA